MPRQLLVTLAAVCAVPLLPATAGAAVPPTQMEHSVRVTTYERPGRGPTQTVRDEWWVGHDRARVVGAKAELVYTPDVTWNYQPGVGVFRWPGTPSAPDHALTVQAATTCGRGHADVRRVGTDVRLGRTVEVTRLVGRASRGARATTTCWVDAASGALLERRLEQVGPRVSRTPQRRTIDTMRVELVELVPRGEAALALSPAGARLPVSPVPLPFP